MRYSGIAVRCAPADLAAVAARLAGLPGVEVHARDDARGRLVLVHEAADLEIHEARLIEIQRAPGVGSAELVIHVDDSLAPPPAAPGDAAGTARRSGAPRTPPAPDEGAGRGRPAFDPQVAP